MAVDSFSRFVAELSRQSKVVAITSTIICLIAVADGSPPPPPLDGTEQLMELIFIDRSEVRSICCAEDRIGDFCAED